MLRLLDAHCHLQDPRILSKAPHLIKTAQDTGVAYFAVNGVSEQDWHSVKQLAETYPSVIPCFGLHPWFVKERSPNWFQTLKEYFDSTPSAAVGEIGVDKGSHGKKIDFSEQVGEPKALTFVQIEVLRQQLELAKELNKPASVHCVRAFGDLLELMNLRNFNIFRFLGPFPAGVILHSYLGSAEMVHEFSKLGAYFSFSGFLMSLKASKAKKMLKMVPPDRILLETDAPDALPMSNIDSLYFVEGDTSLTEELLAQTTTSSTSGSSLGNSSHVLADASMLPKETLNHPANIHNVLDYVASMLEITKEELAELSYQNAVRLLSYEGSKVLQK
ncbi:D-aminoacyl-tRNA deacylase [Glycine max]|nr:D-aminoacyl-tRNA deacylase [Glycine max]